MIPFRRWLAPKSFLWSCCLIGSEEWHEVELTKDGCPTGIEAMTRLRQVYKITYPNGKIYARSDLTGTLTYFGSPIAQEQIAETATKAEVLAMELDSSRSVTQRGMTGRSRPLARGTINP
jgi:hypothetical protein